MAENEKHLTASPARMLTDREVAKILTGFIGTLLPMCECGADTIINVLCHLREHHSDYIKVFIEMQKNLQSIINIEKEFMENQHKSGR